MHRHSLTFFARAAAAGLAIVAITACTATGGPEWTYAPLGPTAPAASPTPASTPAGTVIEVSTPADNALAFVPNSLDAPANADVTIRYLNESAVPHNIQVFNGPDNTAPSLGKTAIESGPAATEDLTFTTPGPGDYYFWCDVHLAAMSGTLHVQ